MTPVSDTNRWFAVPGGSTPFLPAGAFQSIQVDINISDDTLIAGAAIAK